MTHSLDNREVYFPIEARREDSREEKLGDTYPRRAYTIEGISVGPKREELVRPKRNPFQCKHVQLLAYAFSRPFTAYRNGGGNRSILGT